MPDVTLSSPAIVGSLADRAADFVLRRAISVFTRESQPPPPPTEIPIIDLSDSVNSYLRQTTAPIAIEVPPMWFRDP